MCSPEDAEENKDEDRAHNLLEDPESLGRHALGLAFHLRHNTHNSSTPKRQSQDKCAALRFPEVAGKELLG